MKISTLALIAFTTLFLSAFSAVNVQAQFGTLFTVNHNGDTNDANAGDGFCADSNGNCTLRAAIQEANADPIFLDGINFALPNPSTIDLTLGELTLSSHIYIAGPGARKLTVQRSPAAGTADFRIFRVSSTNIFPYPTTIRGLSIKNGKTTSDGGAVYTDYDSFLQLTEVAITNNTAASGGAVFSAGTLYLTRSLVSSNTGTGLFGGGIININTQGTSIISNSTITNNSGEKGGGIYNFGSLLLVNNTISHNTASIAGSSVLNDSVGTVNVLNTIIGMDVSSTASSLSGAFNSLGNNLITDARNSTGFTNGTNGDQVSNNNTINPLLGALADNGGQTDTRALLDGSPAINAGSSCVYTGTCSQPLPQNFRLTTDQRKNNRRLGGSTVDVGAFEYQSNGFSGSVTLGTFGNNTRAGGSLAILTIAGTNQKQVRISNQFGNHRFPNLPLGEVVFLELKPKRANQRQGLLVFEQDNILILSQPLTLLEKDDFKIILSK
jgi:CSLREA domain-containing protein